jgi:nicotinate-nucleotide adenylyltransferase
MVEAAARDVDGLEVSDLDIRAETPSYSSDLLRRCSQLWSNAALWFIIGADSLNDFHTWHEPTCVLHRARLAVAARPGWSVPEILASTPLAVLREHTDAFESVPLDISATLIRERLGRGLPVDWLVPEPVIAYSRKHALYR